MSSTPVGLVGFTGLCRRGRATKYGDEPYRPACPLYLQFFPEPPYCPHVGWYFYGLNDAETT